jgi:hypothetical protein
MKNYIFIIILAFSFIPGYAKNDSGRKAARKFEKMQNKTADMQDAAMMYNDRKAIRKMNKMEKKKRKCTVAVISDQI